MGEYIIVVTKAETSYPEYRVMCLTQRVRNISNDPDVKSYQGEEISMFPTVGEALAYIQNIT